MRKMTVAVRRKKPIVYSMEFYPFLYYSRADVVDHTLDFVEEVDVVIHDEGFILCRATLAHGSYGISQALDALILIALEDFAS